jgi:hypothetical protein
MSVRQEIFAAKSLILSSKAVGFNTDNLTDLTLNGIQVITAQDVDPIGGLIPPVTVLAAPGDISAPFTIRGLVPVTPLGLINCITISKIGQFVSLRFPAFSITVITANANGLQLMPVGSIPVSLRPVFSAVFPTVVQEAGVTSSNISFVRIETDGSVTLNRNVVGNVFFGACGLPFDSVFTWSIQ